MLSQPNAERPSDTPPRQLLDHLIGASEQRLRDRKSERLGGVHIDKQLEFGRLLHGQLAWFYPLSTYTAERPHIALKSGPYDIKLPSRT